MRAVAAGDYSCDRESRDAVARWETTVGKLSAIAPAVREVSIWGNISGTSAFVDGFEDGSQDFRVSNSFAGEERRFLHFRIVSDQSRAVDRQWGYNGGNGCTVACESFVKTAVSRAVAKVVGPDRIDGDQASSSAEESGDGYPMLVPESLSGKEPDRRLILDNVRDDLPPRHVTSGGRLCGDRRSLGWQRSLFQRLGRLSLKASCKGEDPKTEAGQRDSPHAGF